MQITIFFHIFYIVVLRKSLLVQQQVVICYLRFIAIAHEQGNLSVLVGADSLGNGILNAARLDAHVNDIRHIARQSEVGHRLHEQQGEDDNNRPDKRFQVFYQVKHYFYPS